MELFSMSWSIVWSNNFPAWRHLTREISHTAFSASRVFKAHLELFVLGSVVFRCSIWWALLARGSYPEVRGTCNSCATCVHIVTRGHPVLPVILLLPPFNISVS